MPNYCAKGIDSNITCLDYDNLKTIALSYNKFMVKNNSNDYISQDIINSNNIKLLLQEIKKKLNCDDDLCIIKQSFIDKIKNNKIIYHKFKPEGPLKNEWLSNWDIDLHMLRFQNYYECLLYTGTVSIDFNIKKMYKIYKNVFHNKSNYNSMSCFYHNSNYCTVNNKNKINCIATIYNTSKRSEPGQHWIATFVKKMPDNKIKMFFFDSAGSKPPKEINTFFKILEKKIFSSYEIDKKYNYLQHQFSNTECGVYCIDFIDFITSNPNSYQDYILKKTSDDIINKKRFDYFRPIIS